MMENLTDRLKEHARRQGADLVGIASIDRFEEVAPHEHPASILPEAKSVIVLAREIPRGALRGIEEGTTWWAATDVLAPRISYEVCRFLEGERWEGVPIYPLSLARWPEGVAVAPDKPAPNVTPSFTYGAVAAGLGEIGYCRVFLTPEFGHRQQLGMVITDAELRPDPLSEDRVCEGLDCAACIGGCPLGAISAEETEGVSVAGREATVGKINFTACRKCPNGAFANRSDQRGQPNRISAACMRACMVHLEETGRLEKKYHQPFRRREPWALDLLDAPADERTYALRVLTP
jgi:epoxyqueuosine reductase